MPPFGGSIPIALYGFVPLHMSTMTTSIAPTSSIVAEFCGGTSSDMEVAMMIGVGLIKDSDAVFFQYVGEEQEPRALTLPTSGKPVYRFQNVRLIGIDIAEDIGTFKSTKLNVYLESSAGNVVLVTSGLTTLWSQSVISSLMGLYNSYDLSTPFTLNSWKGDQGMRPCFSNIKVGTEKVTDQMMYDQLRELRGDRASDKINAVMRDSVQILDHALKGTTESVVVEVSEPASAEISEELPF